MRNPATCGVTMQLGNCNKRSSDGIGSTSATSRAADSMVPATRASASAAPSTTGPREVFTNIDVGFISAKVSALIRWRVSAVDEQWMLT